MARMTTPMTLWTDGMRFWMQLAQAQTEMALRMWALAGVPFVRSMDSDVEALCAAAAKPADVPDPVKKPAAKAAAARTQDPADKPAARTAAPAGKPAAQASAAPAGKAAAQASAAPAKSDTGAAAKAEGGRKPASKTSAG